MESDIPHCKNPTQDFHSIKCSISSDRPFFYSRPRTKVGKQPSKLNEGSKVCMCFYQLDLVDYCFITSASFVPVAVSIQIIHHWTKKEDKSSQQCSLDYLGTHPHY